MLNEPSPSEEPSDPTAETVVAPVVRQSDEGLSDKNLPNRRAFLRNVLCDVAALSGSYKVISPLFATTSDTSVPQARQKSYPHIDRDISFDENLKFRSLGVEHAPRAFKLHGEYVLERIKEYDTVLIEGCPGSDYFDYMVSTCLDNNKKVFFLEENISRIPFVLGHEATFFLKISVILFSIWHYRERLCNYIERRFGRDPDAGLDDKPSLALAIGAWSTHALESVLGVDPRTTRAVRERSYYLADMTYYTDGRTVLMLDRVHSYVKEHPDESVLVLTGDTHALGFVHYLESPEGRKEYPERLAQYKAGYDRFFGGEIIQQTERLESPFHEIFE